MAKVWFTLSFIIFFWTSGANGLEPVVLQLKWTHQFQFAGYYMAAEQGFYKEAGLKVTILPANPSNPDTHFKVLSGQAQFGVTHSGVLKAKMDGKPLVALAAIFQSSPYCWMVKESSNIYKPEDFLGKKVSHLGKEESAELTVMLERVGINISDLPLYAGLNPLEDFKRGMFDAIQVYVTNEPYKMLQEGVKTRQICPKQYGLNVYGDILFTSENMLAHKPETVEKFKQASLKGWRYALLNMQHSIEVIHEKYARHKTKEQLSFEADELATYITHSGGAIGSMSETRWQWIAQLYNLDLSQWRKIKSTFLYQHKHDTTDSSWSWMLVLACVLTLLSIPMYGYLMLFHKRKYRIQQLSYHDKNTLE
ncbi:MULTISPECIES: ABC transporter substrate-binding protein [unclassified Pseudoalteromonas]|uniref:ABC transporter substrate-binding protein n=1 Tax=unclassified Pseudoalteromonas TaxID=194690 RepID=UPI001B39FEC8|nr:MULTISPECIES: ABC transporter substrate-binding protein [unclassified Pseudoalteromonas]MBQ4844248.1 ABC transporter substrate-binding protein [Pseudoalteromonas sp. MMG005]MBQ4850133.1 ABC transporter substrate-binding protein [Pseudoalteromonas sp. MMG012]